jgi:Domain of unknown function (DUF4129)
VNRAAKAGGLAFGLIGLLIVVALAARGGHPSSTGSVSPRAVPDSVQDSFVTLLAIAYVIAIGAALVLLFRFRSRWTQPQSHWLRNYVMVLLLMTAISGFGYWTLRHTDFRRHAQEQAAQDLRQAKEERRRGLPRLRATPARTAHFQWPVAAALGGLVALGGIIVVVIRARTPPGRPLPRGVEAELSRAVETTIADLRRERDARRAVIAAYANMERVFAGHGLGRLASEAPFEYLGRMLRTLRVREEAVQTLTRLFARARFSGHDIDAAMKEEAIAALIAVREDLYVEERAAA